MKQEMLKRVAGYTLLLIAAMCPVIFMAMHHYWFVAFDHTQGFATFISCMAAMMMLGGVGMMLTKNDTF